MHYSQRAMSLKNVQNTLIVVLFFMDIGAYVDILYELVNVLEEWY